LFIIITSLFTEAKLREATFGTYTNVLDDKK